MENECRNPIGSDIDNSYSDLLFSSVPNAFFSHKPDCCALIKSYTFLELALCAVAGLDKIASVLGQVLQWLLYSMNYFVEKVSRLPFAVWEHLYLSLLQTLLLYVLIFCLSVWLFTKVKWPL